MLRGLNSIKPDALHAVLSNDVTLNAQNSIFPLLFNKIYLHDRSIQKFKWKRKIFGYFGLKWVEGLVGGG